MCSRTMAERNAERKGDLLLSVYIYVFKEVKNDTENIHNRSEFTSSM